jgi:predicted Ser/Thr protein kinase
VTSPRSIGRYTVTGELGRGAMGVVYRGVDPSLDRQVAIKVISARETAGEAGAEELEARFLREARVSARINHPGVVTVYDAGRDGDGLFLVMELVEGRSLSQIRRSGGRYGAPEALLLAAEVADALGAAHQLGVVHRDIKPANILITGDGRAKVTDFGVAKAVGEGTELTRTGIVLGSPAYMSPEQVRGERVDGRADLFSLGVVLYELLMDRKPFPADTVTTLIYQILNTDPFGDPEVTSLLGAELAGFLRRGLAKVPEDRFPDAASFAREARALAARLGEISVGETVATRMPMAASGAAESGAGPSPRPRWLPLGAAAGVVVVVAVVFGVRALSRRATPPEPTAVAALAVTETPTVAPSPTPEPTAVATATPEPPTPAPTPGFRRLTLGAESPVAAGTEPEKVAQARSETPRARPATVKATRPATPVPAIAPPEPTAAADATEAAQAEEAAAVPAEYAGVYECRQGAQFSVKPKDAKVSVDGKVIGVASDFGGGLIGRLSGKLFSFGGPGTYEVEISADGYRTVRVKVIVRAGAEKRITKIDLDLPPLAPQGD